MSRFLSFLLFIGIALSIYFLMHWFIYKVLTGYLAIMIKHSRLLKYFLLLSGLSFPAAMFLGRWVKFPFLTYYAYIWLGILAISFFILLLAWVLLKIFPSLSTAFILAGLVCIGLISGYSLVNGLRLPTVTRLEIGLENLPAELDGFSIVQLTDLHLDAVKMKGVLDRVEDRVADIKPDLIVITGDLLDRGHADDIREVTERLKRLKAKWGVLAVTGNHEFYEGLPVFLNLAKNANIRVLRQEMQVVAGSLQVIGLDDPTAKRGGPGKGLVALIGTCDPGKPIILLQHRPTGFLAAAAAGVDLQLSGHTHAGQIPPMDLLVYLYYRHPYGLYREGGAYIYTSSGTGLWGPPMRFLNKNEIVHIILRRRI